jgi:hypothetical protein
MFDSQQRMEQLQDTKPVDTDRYMNAARGQSWQCAWCLYERGLALGDGSHGICPHHTDQVLQQYRASRRPPHNMLYVDGQ